MSDRYKMGLTRNRLFEFDNCVLFAGRFDSPIDCDAGKRALKLLFLEEPLLSAKIELEANGDAYVVTDFVSQKIALREERLVDIIAQYKCDGLRFYEQLFEFSLSADGYFVIAGHTCVADAKSLLRLAMCFSELYKTNAFSVNPSQVNIVSERVGLPLEVLSPVTDKLSVELASEWAEKPACFGVEDYKRAKKAYASVRSESATLKAELSEAAFSRLTAYAKNNGLDVSSVVGYAFYEKLCENTRGRASLCKMNVYGDSRFFFEDERNIGAYNGVVSAYLRKKERKKSVDERVKAFHITRYKAATSTFRVMYDDVFLMFLSPSLCDGTYMLSAGCFKNKTAEKVADNYGCRCEKICDYFSCNLDQVYWQGLNSFSDVVVNEPFKMRSYSYLGFVVKNGRGYVTFSYKKSAFDDKKAEKIFKNALELIEKFE